MRDLAFRAEAKQQEPMNDNKSRQAGEAPSAEADKRHSSAETDTHPAAPPHHAAALSIIIGIMLAMFLSALEQTIVAPALPTIGRNLGDIDHLSWVVTAYLLSATVATPLFGKLSDIYAPRRTMHAVVIGFILGAGTVALVHA